MKNKICCLLITTSLLGLSSSAFPGAANDALGTPAILMAKADSAVLQAVTRAGNRLVAAGERGVVLLSDDNGLSWRQAKVPVSTTLTAIQFVDASNGWAVGHSGVVLHSTDGGETWALQLDGRKAAELEFRAASSAGNDESAQYRVRSAQRLIDDGADKPFLSLAFADAQHGLVVGAFGMVFHTDDGGVTWTSWMDRVTNPHGLHIYAAVQQGSQIYLAGEQGFLLRSLDGGHAFSALQPPYEGSYFAAALLPDSTLVIAGLRGNIFFSIDRGESFQSVTSPAPVSWNAINLSGDQLLFVNQAGAAFQSSSARLDLLPVAAPPGHPLTALARADDGTLVGVGFVGVSSFAPTLAGIQSTAE